MKNPPLNRTLKTRAADMRKNMTKEEFKLWRQFLRYYPYKFRRQKVVGTFILDFYCDQAKLGIELDGSQHYSDYGKNYDAWRSHIIEREGIAILRFSNLDVLRQFGVVCTVIDRTVRERIASFSGTAYEPE